MDRLVPWLRRTTWLYVLLALALGVAAWWLARRPAQPVPVTPVAIERQEPAEYLVHVAGAVRSPGVYRIGGDGRVIQAIRLAGGPTAAARLDGVNLAAPVRDGQQIVVPRAGTGTGADAPGATGPVSLSSATVAQLDALDGIGPTLAARIVSWRDEHGGFESVDQLTDVPGIGAARLEALRRHLAP